ARRCPRLRRPLLATVEGGGEKPMPFEIRKDGPDAKPYCVYTKSKSDAHGCHPTEAEAKKQLAALYANVPEAREARKTDYVITLGAAVKAMGDGVIGGYVVQFGHEATEDVT